METINQINLEISPQRIKNTDSLIKKIVSSEIELLEGINDVPEKDKPLVVVYPSIRPGNIYHVFMGYPVGKIIKEYLNNTDTYTTTLPLHKCMKVTISDNGLIDLYPVSIGKNKVIKSFMSLLYKPSIELLTSYELLVGITNNVKLKVPELGDYCRANFTIMDKELLCNKCLYNCIHNKNTKVNYLVKK